MSDDFRHDLYVVHEEDKEIYHFVRHDGVDELEQFAGHLKLNAKLAQAQAHEDEARETLRELLEAEPPDYPAINAAKQVLREARLKRRGVEDRIKMMTEHVAQGSALMVIPSSKVLSTTNGTCYLINLGALQPDRRDWVPGLQQRLLESYTKDLEEELQGSEDPLDLEYLDFHLNRIDQEKTRLK